ncbi:hypothetical protein GALL_304370 [mine drainage metagenome]|uniref:Uncharacterized protein n=1 Tax=mine drainage metagenome TaxID=410659 RepID=A0A1J5R6M7_9ZZZZ
MKPFPPTLRLPTRRPTRVAASAGRPGRTGRGGRNGRSGTSGAVGTVGARVQDGWASWRTSWGPGWTGSAIDGAPRWAAGVIAGIQAALLSLLVVAAPALATYVSTSADPTNADVGWQRSVALASSLWLLAHGVPLVTASATITLVPLGLSALAVFSCYASARRSGRATWSGFAGAVGAYALVTVVVAVVVDRTLQGIVLAFVGAVVVGGVGLGAGLLARPGAPSLREVTRAGWERLPAPARVGAAGGVLALAVLVLVASVLVVAWVLGGRATISDILAGLGLDPVGGIVLGLAEATLAPNLVVWGLSWLAGPGFAVGTGSVFSPAHVVAGPLPALPILGALPQPDSAGGLLRWAPVVLVLAGAVGGLWTVRRRPAGPWWHAPATAATLAVAAGVGVAALVVLAGGAVGPGRMLDVGAQAGVVGTAATAELLLGALLVLLPTDGPLRDEVARGIRRAVRSAQGLTPESRVRSESIDD